MKNRLDWVHNVKVVLIIKTVRVLEINVGLKMNTKNIKLMKGVDFCG